jgi:hypothetical protein
VQPCCDVVWWCRSRGVVADSPATATFDRWASRLRGGVTSPSQPTRSVRAPSRSPSPSRSAAVVPPSIKGSYSEDGAAVSSHPSHSRAQHTHSTPTAQHSIAQHSTHTPRAHTLHHARTHHGPPTTIHHQQQQDHHHQQQQQQQQQQHPPPPTAHSAISVSMWVTSRAGSRCMQVLTARCRRSGPARCGATRRPAHTLSRHHRAGLPALHHHFVDT